MPPPLPPHTHNVPSVAGSGTVHGRMGAVMRVLTYCFA